MARSVEDLQSDLVAGLSPTVTLTPEARSVVKDAIASEPDPEHLALWVEVRGVDAGAYVYDLYFQALSDATDDDSVGLSDDLPVVVPGSSVDQLRGARLEWSDEGDGGLLLVNPNVPRPEQTAPSLSPEILEAGTDGPLGQRVTLVLERDVNPAIAAHGGRADLVAMDEERAVAYLQLSGGCQGCASSRATLQQTIEIQLRNEIPELVSVVDVTDHASGENPYR